MASNVSNRITNLYYLEEIQLKTSGTPAAVGYKFRHVVPSRYPEPLEFDLTRFEAAWKEGNIAWTEHFPLILENDKFVWKGNDGILHLKLFMHPRKDISVQGVHFYGVRDLKDSRKFTKLEHEGVICITDYDSSKKDIHSIFKARFDALPVFIPKPPAKKPNAPAPVLPTPSAPSLSSSQSTPIPSAPILSNSQVVQSTPKYIPTPPSKRPVSAAPAPVLPTPSAPTPSSSQSTPFSIPSAPTLPNSQVVQGIPKYTPAPPAKRPVSAAPTPVLPTPSAPSLSIIQSNPFPTPSAPSLSNSQFVQSVPKYIPAPPSKRPEGQKA